MPFCEKDIVRKKNFIPKIRFFKLKLVIYSVVSIVFQPKKKENNFKNSQKSFHVFGLHTVDFKCNQ